MKNLIAAMIVFASASLSLAQTNSPAPSREAAQVTAGQTLQALEREWADAVVHRDVDVIDRIQADDFAFTGPDGQIWTKARSLDFIKAGSLKLDSFEMNEFSIRIYGDTAIVNFRVVWNGKSREIDISGAQRMTDIFQLRDGHWRCISSQTTRIPASNGG